MKLALIVVAAGNGTRMQLGTNKIFGNLNQTEGRIIERKSAPFFACQESESLYSTNEKVVDIENFNSHLNDEDLNLSDTVLGVTLTRFKEILKNVKVSFSQLIITYRKEDYNNLKALVEQVFSKEELRDHLCSIKLVEGGSQRFLSVHNAIAALDDTITHVLVHDGVRPFVPISLYNRLVEKLENSKVVIPAIRFSDTIRTLNVDKLGETLDRNKLCAIQTPQCYDIEIAKAIYNYVESIKTRYGTKFESMLNAINDDSSLIALVCPDVEHSMVEGSKYNIKITIPEDLEFARMLYEYTNRWD